MQDVVEALFDEKGATGAWMKDILEQERYWGYSRLLSCIYVRFHANISLLHSYIFPVIGRCIHRRRLHIHPIVSLLHFGSM